MLFSGVLLMGTSVLVETSSTLLMEVTGSDGNLASPHIPNYTASHP
jgi:hypothetical protein